MEQNDELTPAEKWAISLLRSTLYGQVVFNIRDSEICTADVKRVLKPGDTP